MCQISAKSEQVKGVKMGVFSSPPKRIGYFFIRIEILSYSSSTCKMFNISGHWKGAKSVFVIRHKFGMRGRVSVGPVFRQRSHTEL